uniref:FlgD/Vpr Ig-like domain-containing protein n=1 Tax=Eiseniibacteriota bacterium TaxID=2212470 RepID=A0A832HZT5_UNCEI
MPASPEPIVPENRRSAPRASTHARRAAAVALALAAAAAGGSPAVAQTVRDDLFMANGTVQALALSGDTLYVGGSFTAVGPATGSGVPLDAATGLAVPGFPRIVGQVSAVAPDGAGGWYVGGAFTSVGGVPRANLAHVRADHSVGPWDPGASGPVLALLASGDTVYVGGTFSSLGGETRNNIGAVNAGRGRALAWSPSANGTVRALAAGPGAIYAAGSFTVIGGQARDRIAALDPASGLATAWNPGANSTVRAVVAGPGVVWIGGDFASAGGQPRARLAALDASSGLATAWNPGASAPVLALAAGDGVVYAGGSFTTVAGQARNRIAALDAASGLATAWNPGANAQVAALAVNGGTVYAGGEFTAIGGAERSRIAALDAASGLAAAWDPSAYAGVSALAVQGGVVWAGGAFNGMGGTRRANLAALDAASGVALAWDPGADQPVQALLVDDGVVYAGGSFTHAGSAPRNHLAALDRASGLATAWNPNPDGPVAALALLPGRLLAGGLFGHAGGAPRANLAALDLVTGAATAWNPGADGQVFALAAAGGVVVAGGSFTQAGGAPRANVAALDAATGAATPWNPGANGTVRALVASCGTVYAAGFFTVIGGQPRASLAALDAATGLATPWNPGANGPVLALALDQGTAYVGGVMNVVAGQVRNRIAALRVADGAATPWDPNANGVVRALAVGGGRAFAGGSFTGMGTLAPANLAGMDADASNACTPIAVTPGALAPATAGEPYAASLAAAGGSAPYCWAVTAGALPPGLALDRASGALSGTPLAAGSFSFTVSATDVSACAGEAAFELAVGCAPRAVLPAALADGVAGFAYADTLTASAGAPPFAWAVTAGALPAGLALDAATGVIAGTPLAGGNAAFSVSVTDAYGCAATADRTLTVFATPPISTVTPATGGACLSATRTCVTVPFVFTRSDSAPVRVVSVTFRADPARLALCTPGDPGASIRQGPWLDAFGNTLQQIVAHGDGSFTVDQAILGLPCGATGGGVLFTVDLAAAGPDGPAAVTVTDVRVRDCDNAPVGAVAGPAGSVEVHLAPMALAPDTLADAAVGVPYEAAITASPGLAPLAFAITAGAPPPGLALAPGGALAGTATAFGSFAFTVTATDAGGCTGSRAYALDVVCPPIAALPAALPSVVAGVPYAQALAASAGVPPFTFALASGALPPGLALSPDGTLSGASTALGSHAFSVAVTDGAACAGETPYTLHVVCPPLTVLPPSLPDAVLDEPYALALSASAGTAPFTWSVTAGALPGGLALDPATGEISGVPLAAGNAWFTVSVTDASGCGVAEDRTLSVLPATPVSSIGAAVGERCISTAHPCAEVPFIYSRADSAPVRVVSVTFRLEPGRLALCTPADPGASITQGPWLDGFATFQQVVDHGGGLYTVDQAILGEPCGATGGGVLFTVRVAAAGPDGDGDLAVTSVRVRDCGNAPVGAIPGPAAALPIDRAGPPPVTDLAAAQVLSGNGAAGTTGIALAWTPPAEGEVDVYRAPFGAYPEYDDGPASVPDPALAPGAPWTLAAAAATPPFVDAGAPRGFWHHVAIVRDACGNRSAPSAATAGALNYHLGDVTDGATPGAGDNRVGPEDVSLLGRHYGILGATLAARGVAYLDVGPTTDLAPTSRPVTDNALDFEDLMVFVANYRAVSAPQAAAAPAAAAPGAAAASPGAPAAPADEVSVEAPARVAAGETFEARLRVRASGRAHGLSAALAWDPAVAEPLGHRSGGFVEAQGGVVLAPRPGVVDAALLGARGAGLAGEGELAAVRFRARAAGAPGLGIARLLARDRDNRPLEPGAPSPPPPAAPVGDALLAPRPNPARGGATLVFTLAAPGDADLALFAVDGRRVRTLWTGARAAGVHAFAWDGADDRGAPLAPGIYHARLSAAGRIHVRRLVLLR